MAQNVKYPYTACRYMGIFCITRYKGEDSLKISFSYEENRLVAYLSGELDHHSAGGIMTKLINEIDAELPRDCVIDMKGVTFMDSSGIAVVLKSYKKMTALGGRLWVENVQSQPMHVFDAAGIDRITAISALG